ncbi:unnamed protein product [Blepharisma stoltei]|uniref:Uncharacterized protein n=1 Tax=Blepharisma stoltei TaxID=1481888 RepID=A0AAU9JB16_9CILI|nr:unnamed protein product [Blepharisma stoltei]
MFIFLLIPFALAGTTINGDFDVHGIVSCSSIQSESLETDGDISISSSLKANELHSTYMTAEKIYVDTITSGTGSITIEGDLLFSTQSSSSFLETSWSLKEHNTFQNSHEGWSHLDRHSCDGINHFLGGKCELAEQELGKTFNISRHNLLRVTATLHMLGPWNGESAYMKIDGNIVWSQSGLSHHSGLKICGQEFPDTRYGIHIDVTVPHISESAEVKFGSTLKSEPCLASFAVDDVMIYSRIKL